MDTKQRIGRYLVVVAVVGVYVALGFALWGLWHLPISFAVAGLMAIPSLLGVHIAVGVPLALSFRKGRNLAVPAITHAFIDAVRNGFGLQG